MSHRVCRSPRQSILAIVAAGLLVGCTGGTTPPTPASSTPRSATPSPSRTASPIDHLTGFGASAYNWNRRHVEVHAAGCEAGAAYDANPRLDSFPGCPGSKYVGVDDFRGRIDEYQVNFPPGTSLAATLAAEAAEIPPDARLIRQLRPGPCVISFYQSVMLAQLHRAALGNGAFTVTSAATPKGHRFLSLVIDDPSLPPITRC